MGEGGFNIAEMWPIALMFVLLYFMMIRPQQKRQKEQAQMLTALSEGDEIVTASGLMGRIAHIGDSHISVEVAPGIEIKMQKNAVTTLLPKGTLDNPESLPPAPPSCCA